MSRFGERMHGRWWSTALFCGIAGPALFGITGATLTIATAALLAGFGRRGYERQRRGDAAGIRVPAAALEPWVGVLLVLVGLGLAWGAGTLPRWMAASAAAAVTGGAAMNALRAGFRVGLTEDLVGELVFGMAGWVVMGAVGACLFVVGATVAGGWIGLVAAVGAGGREGAVFVTRGRVLRERVVRHGPIQNSVCEAIL